MGKGKKKWLILSPHKSSVIPQLLTYHKLCHLVSRYKCKIRDVDEAYVAKNRGESVMCSLFIQARGQDKHHGLWDLSQAVNLSANLEL